MRHRMTTVHTGLGNPEKHTLDNQWTDYEDLNKLIEEMLLEAIHLWFNVQQFVDFSISVSESGIIVKFGIEASYQFDSIKIVCVDTNRVNSYFSRGVAWGSYGSHVARTVKLYIDYKYSCKFTRFINKWSTMLNKYFKENLKNIKDIKFY